MLYQCVVTFLIQVMKSNHRRRLSYSEDKSERLAISFVFKRCLSTYIRRQKVSSYRYIKQNYPNFQHAVARIFLSFFFQDCLIKAVA